MMALILAKAWKPATKVPMTAAAAPMACPKRSKNCTTRLIAGGTVVVSQSIRRFRRGMTSVWNTDAAALIFGTTFAVNCAAKFLRAGRATSRAHVVNCSIAGTRCSIAADASAVTAGRTRPPALAAKSPRWALRTWIW